MNSQKTLHTSPLRGTMASFLSYLEKRCEISRVNYQREVGTRFASLIFANMRLANLVPTSRCWVTDTLSWLYHTRYIKRKSFEYQECWVKHGIIHLYTGIVIIVSMYGNTSAYHLNVLKFQNRVVRLITMQNDRPRQNMLSCRVNDGLSPLGTKPLSEPMLAYCRLE